MNITVRKSDVTDLIAMAFNTDDVSAEQVKQDGGYFDAWQWKFYADGVPCTIQLTGQVFAMTNEEFHKVLSREIEGVKLELAAL